MGFRILRLVEICLWGSGILLVMVEVGKFPGSDRYSFYLVR